MIGTDTEGTQAPVTRVALIVGASTGVGASCAALMANRGFTVVGVARRAELVREHLATFGPQHHAHFADVTDRVSIAALRAWLVERELLPDVVIYSAGVGHFGPIEQCPPEIWNEVFATNVRGANDIIAEIAPLLGEGSRIILVSSTAGRTPFEGGSAYCASKAALNALAQVAREELAPRGILVSTVVSGTINTPFWRKPRTDTDQILDPGTVAEAIVLVASQPANSVTSELVLQPKKELNSR